MSDQTTIGRFTVGRPATLYGLGGLVTATPTALAWGEEFGERVIYVTYNVLGDTRTVWQRPGD